MSRAFAKVRSMVPSFFYYHFFSEGQCAIIKQLGWGIYRLPSISMRIHMERTFYMSFFSNTMSKLFGTHSQREVKTITPLVDRIEALEDSYKQMPEAELKGQTAVLRERLNK